MLKGTVVVTVTKQHRFGDVQEAKNLKQMSNLAFAHIYFCRHTDLLAIQWRGWIWKCTAASHK